MAVLSAQSPVYNPRALWFQHDDYSLTETYRVQVYQDGADYQAPPLYAVEIPRATAKPSVTDPGGYELQFTDLPLLPVGKSYRASMTATNLGGTSAPSNITPELWRINSCARPGAAGVTLPSLTVQTMPALKKGESAIVTLAIRVPFDTTFVMLDLLADQQPATYYVTKVAPGVPSTVQVFWGPFPRAGNFELAGQVIDSGGCQASLPAGTRVTIAP